MARIYQLAIGDGVPPSEFVLLRGGPTATGRSATA
jgi:hypothetical protein